MAAESDAEVHAAYRAALARFDELNTRTIEATSACLDCRAGCSLCCESLRVDVYAHEAFLIADHIQSHFAEEQRAALWKRLEKHAAQVLPLTPFEHATRNIPCPLLQEGRCSIYAVRPQACRRHHSLDVRTCQYACDHPTDLQAPAAHSAELFATLTAAMAENTEAYRQLGLDTTVYELGTALQEALDDPGSWAGWKGHMEAFIRASVTPMA